MPSPVRGKMDDASYIARPLATFPCCVVAAPSLLEKCGQPARCEQLVSLPCITTVSALKGQAWQFITAQNAFKKVNVQAHFRVNSGEIALHAAVAGVGFAILAEQACRPFIASGQLKVIELELPAAPLHLVALYRERHFLPARSRVWLDFMQQHLAAN